MSDFPQPLILNTQTVLDPVSNEGTAAVVGAYMGGTGVFSASTAWTAANRAVFVCVPVRRALTVVQMAVEVVTQSGNIDVGIYDESGARLVNKGATAVGAAGIQSFDITDTPLTPGIYYLAVAVDNTTAALRCWNAGDFRIHRPFGHSSVDTAYTLPSTFTPGAQASATVRLPYICAFTKTTF